MLTDRSRVGFAIELHFPFIGLLMHFVIVFSCSGKLWQFTLFFFCVDCHVIVMLLLCYCHVILCMAFEIKISLNYSVSCDPVYCACCLANHSIPGLNNIELRPHFYVNVADIEALENEVSYVACE